jgi:hypothetical protein
MVTLKHTLAVTRPSTHKCPKFYLYIMLLVWVSINKWCRCRLRANNQDA